MFQTFQRRTPKTEDHYRTLGLSKNCTTKEVRDAFVSLSKIHHPDRHSNNPESNAKFVKINEAYSVLSKPNQRRSYDFDLLRSRSDRGNTVHNRQSAYYYYTPPGKRPPRPDPPWSDETINRGNAARAKSYSFYQSSSYYGFRGYGRQPNAFVAGAAFAVMGIGILFHFLAFKYSTTFDLGRIEKQQEIYYSRYEKVRETARTKSTEEKLEELEKKVKPS